MEGERTRGGRTEIWEKERERASERAREEDEDKEGSWRRARRCIRARTSVWGSERMSGDGGGI